VDAQLDCARIGLVCDPAQGCIEAEAASCTDGATCGPDGRPDICERGVAWDGPDCSAIGLGCDNGACTGTGAECTTFAEPEVVSFRGASCTGNVLHACIGGRLHDVDCATLGPFACHAIGDVAFCGLGAECVPPDSGLPSLSHPPTCDGNTVVYCHMGRIERVDCTTLGFTGCDIDRALNHYGCTPGVAQP
jgi:hypothetical protein